MEKLYEQAEKQESGTRDGFESITKTEDICEYRQELTSTGDVITTVAGNPNAIGYASLASVSDKVKMISVNHVMPSEETVKDGSYCCTASLCSCNKSKQRTF